MNNSPDTLYRFYSGLIFATADALFFLMFTLAYNPFDMENVLDMGSGRAVFNTLMLSCITYGAILILHTLLFWLRSKINRNWWTYIGWWTMELFVAAAYMGMYLDLVDPNSLGYFAYFSLSLKYNFSITIYSHTILNIVFVLIGFIEMTSDKNLENTGLVKFHDYNKQLKFSVARNSLLYINAEENYVRIHYLEDGQEKQFLLRRSMTSIEDAMDKIGLFRCHRSYFVNPSMVSSLKKENGGVITAEISGTKASIPVSKKRFSTLSDRI